MNIVSPIEADHRRRMVDGFGRRITYVRLSVTDRCDFRCVYCMSEHMTFLPKAEVLSLEEIERLGSVFVARGVRKIRLTGGEPLVRRDIVALVRGLARHLGNGLDELTLTTNGSQLARYADDLAASGIRRINVSVDTLDPTAFRAITRGGDIAKVLGGIEAAKAAGIRVKINTVALRGEGGNEHDIPAMIEWAHGAGMDMTLIETMPLGAIEEDRTDQFLPLSLVRQRLAERWTLADLAERSGGPARYVRVEETHGKLGFITPLTHNFCESCNRVRVTCTGTLFMCLGQEGAVDLRAPLRESADNTAIHEAIDRAIAAKPKGHDFVIERGRAPALARHMSMTGG